MSHSVNFPVSFSAEIADEDQNVILDSVLWNDWIARIQRSFVIQTVHFSSADIIRRQGRRTPLFVKLTAQATDFQGRPQHGIVLLRGNAVGILVVLHCEEEAYLLLVEQPRFPLAELRSLEIPAGILDWSSDPLSVALSELREEAQMVVQPDELVDLTAFWQPDSTGFAASCGLLDESIRLYLLERTVSRAELDAMHGRDQQYQDEQEWIRTVVLPYEEAARCFRDGKCFVALFLYERYLRFSRLKCR